MCYALSGNFQSRGRSRQKILRVAQSALSLFFLSTPFIPQAFVSHVRINLKVLEIQIYSTVSQVPKFLQSRQTQRINKTSHSSTQHISVHSRQLGFCDNSMEIRGSVFDISHCNVENYNNSSIFTTSDSQFGYIIMPF